MSGEAAATKATLNVAAAEWRPPGAADGNASAPQASSHGGDTNSAPPDTPPAGPARWQHYPPRGGDAAGYDPSELGDEDEEHLAWAEEQAQLAEQARRGGYMLPHPGAEQRHHGNTGYHGGHQQPQYEPRSYVPPAPRGAPPAWQSSASAAAAPAVRVGGPSASAAPWHPAAPAAQDDDTYTRVGAETAMTTATSIQVGVAVPKSTGKEKRRNYAKEAAREQRRRLIAEKSGLEAFSAALLHSVSPFMSPLRKASGSSLPHIKVDQRFGRRGQPKTAVMQFVIAPVVNYRPAHFHDLAPGDVMEYHFDLGLVLKAIPSAYSLNISYGPDWKPYTLPYAYLSCGDYKGEVLRLCPEEAPNSRSEAHYDDDILKDVTKLILAVPELEVFRRKSFCSALKARVNLYPMYAVFATLFNGLQNYQIMIRDLHAVPPVFILKTSESVLAASEQPLVIAGSTELWPLLKSVPPTFAAPVSKKRDTGATAGAPQKTLEEVLGEADESDDEAADAKAPARKAWWEAIDLTTAVCGALITATAVTIGALLLAPRRR